MLLSAVSVLVVAQSSSVIPEGLMNNPVLVCIILLLLRHTMNKFSFSLTTCQVEGDRNMSFKMIESVDLGTAS